MAASAELISNVKTLQGVVILEKDASGDVLPVWTYPSLATSSEPDPTVAEAVLLARSGLTGETIPARQSFHRFRNHWTYSHVEVCGDGTSGTLVDSRVIAFQVNIIAAEFFPEKYWRLAAALARAYTLSSGDPVTLLECYLQIFSRGRVKDPEKNEMMFDLSEFDNPRAAMLATPLSALAKLLGENFVLLWTAMLLKKRVVFACDKLSLLLKLIRAVPLAVFHRANWDVLRPVVVLSRPEQDDFADDTVSFYDVNVANRAQVADLKQMGHFVAGFTDAEMIREHEAMYDLFIDVNNRTATVSSHATADFTMTSLHKGVFTTVQTALEGDVSDTELVKALAVKTKDIIAKLDSLKRVNDAGASVVDAESIKGAGVTNANLAHFLLGVAFAESLTKG